MRKIVAVVNSCRGRKPTKDTGNLSASKVFSDLVSNKEFMLFVSLTEGTRAVFDVLLSLLAISVIANSQKLRGDLRAGLLVSMHNTKTHCRDVISSVISQPMVDWEIYGKVLFALMVLEFSAFILMTTR